uniref:Neurobeachin-like protein 2 n=1 Tax=Callorhinchus milii TaxID=7868 RepID=A0A4W3GNQ3_CALMI
MLVVAVCTKKEYMTVALPEVCFTDSQWHCVDIVHTAGRRYFGQTVLSIYTDGCLYKTAQLRFPSLTEPYTYCGIGSAGHRTSTTVVTPTPQSAETVMVSRGSLARSLSFPAALAAPTLAPEAIVNTIPAGTQDAEWGSPTSLEGQLGDVSVFHEALQPPQLRVLHAAGPNNVLCIKPDGELWDLSYKLLLHYTPRACNNHMCLDLSPKHLYDGRLTGHSTINWDVKDGLGCVGGMAALLPLLEQVVTGGEEREASAESTELVGPELTARQNIPGMQLPLGKSSGNARSPWRVPSVSPAGVFPP